MRPLYLKMSMSLDGFVCGANGEIEWLINTLDEESTQWILKILQHAGIHIMGRRTFHDMIAYWPFSSEPLAEPMNEIPKTIFSRKGSLDAKDTSQRTTSFREAEALAALRGMDMSKSGKSISPTWTAPRIASGPLTEEINDLKKEEGGYILAHGGASFAQNLVKANCIDKYFLLIHPVVLGHGLALFSELSQARHLLLEDSLSFPTGTVAHVYRNPGKLTVN
jgi:dihydrofolate reductase